MQPYAVCTNRVLLIPFILTVVTSVHRNFSCSFLLEITAILLNYVNIYSEIAQSECLQT